MLNCRGSVVHLLKPVIAFVVPPIDENGPVVDARAILPPAFKAYVGRRKGGCGRSLPGEVTLAAVSSEDDYCTSVAVVISSGLVLPRIANVKDADGSNEIELRAADIDVCAILNEPEGGVGGNEVFTNIWEAPSSLDWLSNVCGADRWKGLSRSRAVGLQERFEDSGCTV